MANDPTKTPKRAERKKTSVRKPHVEIRPLSMKELKRARDEGAFVVIPASCACQVKSGVYGKLIVL